MNSISNIKTTSTLAELRSSPYLDELNDFYYGWEYLNGEYSDIE
jgi:hypothetical protein